MTGLGTNLPQIETARLILIPNDLTEVRADIEAMDAAERSQLSADWLAQLVSEAVDFWTLGFSIGLRDTNVIVGTCGFKGPPDNAGMVEIAYRISPAHQNKGYATEAASGMVDFAFGHHAVRLVRAHTLEAENESAHVLKKCGFQLVGEVNDPEDGPVWRWEVSEVRL